MISNYSQILYSDKCIYTANIRILKTFPFEIKKKIITSKLLVIFLCTSFIKKIETYDKCISKKMFSVHFKA